MAGPLGRFACFWLAAAGPLLVERPEADEDMAYTTGGYSSFSMALQYRYEQPDTTCMADRPTGWRWQMAARQGGGHART